jgi:hypothetical protein
MFGTGAPKPMSLSSMGLFAGRDSMTILASFSLPGLLAERLLRENPGMGRARAETATQLLTPVTMQLLSTPLHLLGLDLYNRSEGVGAAQRWQFVQREYLKTTLARMARIFPAYGVGGVVNKYVRKSGHSYLAE